VVFQYTIVMEL